MNAGALHPWPVRQVTTPRPCSPPTRMRPLPCLVSQQCIWHVQHFFRNTLIGRGHDLVHDQPALLSARWCLAAPDQRTRRWPTTSQQCNCVILHRDTLLFVPRCVVNGFAGTMPAQTTNLSTAESLRCSSVRLEAVHRLIPVASEPSRIRLGRPMVGVLKSDLRYTEHLKMMRVEVRVV